MGKYKYSYFCPGEFSVAYYGHIVNCDSGIYCMWYTKLFLAGVKCTPQSLYQLRSLSGLQHLLISSKLI